MTSEVTQEARNAAADLLHEVGCLLGDDGIGQVADLIRDGEYDDHDATIAFAKFERETIARMNAKPSDDKAIMRELRPSKAAMEKIERMEQANAAGLAEIRNMPFGGAAQSGGGRSFDDMKAEEARIMQDWRWGNLTRLGVANHLRRAGFDIRYATDKANALEGEGRSGAGEDALTIFKRAASLFAQWRSTVMAQFDGTMDGEQWRALNRAFDLLAEARALPAPLVGSFEIQQTLWLARDAITQHHQWHAAQTDPDPEHGYIPADEYADSQLYERTVSTLDRIDKALDGIPAALNARQSGEGEREDDGLADNLERWSRRVTAWIDEFGLDTLEAELCASRNTLDKWASGDGMPRPFARQGLVRTITEYRTALRATDDAGGAAKAPDTGEGEASPKVQEGE